MNTLSKKRRSRFACLALIGLTLGTILAAAPSASAQYGRRGGFYGGRPYGGGGYNRGYNYGGGFNRGFGYGGGFYNRGYGGYGNGLYNRGYYGGGIVTPFASPIAVPQVYGPAYGYGGYGGYY